MNYNKTPRDLTAEQYAIFSKEFRKQMKNESDTVEEDTVEEDNAFNTAAAKAAVAGEKTFNFNNKSYPVKMSKEDAQKLLDENEADMGRFSQTAQNKPIMFKGKQIDLDSVEYDMQDYSDMIFEPEEVKYTDGTDVADEDMEDLMYNDDFVEWVRIDYMDRMQDKADMMRDSKEEDSVKEGGNAFDIAMGDAEAIISDASDDKEAMDNLQKLHDDEDDAYAKSTIKDYMSRLEKEGLSRMQSDIAMADNAGPEESVDPTIARIKDLAGI